MHGLIALDGPLGRGECSKPHPRIHTAFDTPMILFHHIGQVFALSEQTGFWQGAVVLEGVDS
jgi:hypothetical protein